MFHRKTLQQRKHSASRLSTIRVSVATLSVAAALLFSTGKVLALGLGNLQIQSNLDQPLSGYIELNVSSGDDLSTVRAEIASVEEFANLGIDHPEYVNDIELKLET